MGKDAFWRLAAPPAAAAAAAAAAGPAGPAAELALFLPESRRDVKPRGKCFWRSCRPSGPWCFTVSEAPARTSLWSCFEGMGATLWSYSFLSVQKAVLGSGASGQHVFGGRFGVAEAFWRRAASAPAAPAAAAAVAAAATTAAAAAGPAVEVALFLLESRRDVKPRAALALFLPESSRDVKPRGNCFWRSFRLSGPWCFAVSEAPARTSLWSCFEGMGATLWSYSFLSVQKAMLGSGASGQHVFGSRSGVAKAFWRRAASAPAAAAAAGQAVELALFFPESRRDVKPRGSMFLEVILSFSSRVFRCG